MQNSNKTMQTNNAISQGQATYRGVGVKYIKHHNLKCSLKSIKVNRDLNAVVTLDVTG